MSYKATYRTRAYKLRKGGTARTSPVPSMRYEALLREQGARLVCGVDEVGVGAWAGPVVVGAVLLPPGKRIYKVRDSKLLDGPRRRWLSEKVKEQSLCWAIGVCWPAEIDSLGLSEAIRRAGAAAVGNLPVKPDAVLLDGQWNYLKRPLRLMRGSDLPREGQSEQLAGFGEPEMSDPFEGPVKTIVRGDCESVSIACASVVAKVFRDDLMAELASIFGGYRFELNKGYPSPIHKWGLAAYGPSAIHRRLFFPVRQLVDEGVPGRLLTGASRQRA